MSLSQQEIDKLLDPNFDSSPDKISFSDELEASMKIMEEVKRTSYKAPPKKTNNLTTVFNNDRKLNNQYICGGCKKRMHHVYIYRPGGNGKSLHAWCEACNFYHPI